MALNIKFWGILALVVCLIALFSVSLYASNPCPMGFIGIYNGVYCDYTPSTPSVSVPVYNVPSVDIGKITQTTNKGVCTASNVGKIIYEYKNKQMGTHYACREYNNGRFEWKSLY